MLIKMLLSASRTLPFCWCLMPLSALRGANPARHGSDFGSETTREIRKILIFGFKVPVVVVFPEHGQS